MLSGKIVPRLNILVCVKQCEDPLVAFAAWWPNLIDTVFSISRSHLWNKGTTKIDKICSASMNGR